MSDLNYQDEMFLFYLFDSEVNPDASPEVAKELAGFGKDEPLSKILRRVKADYQNEVQNYFLSLSTYAAAKLYEIAKSETTIYNSEKAMKACLEILDRAGITKKDKQEIEIIMPEGIVILPELNQS